MISRAVAKLQTHTCKFKPLPLIKNKKLRILKRDTSLSLSMTKKTKKKAKDSILVDCYMLILQWWSARVWQKSKSAKRNKKEVKNVSKDFIARR